MGDLVEADIEQHYQGGRRMPYIATWSEEQLDTAALTWLAGGRLGYTDETPQDRFRGVLLRQGSARGRGSATPAGIHPRRQPEVMDRLGCQVCAADTNREAATLWKGRRLLFAAEGTSLHDGATTASPPVHRTCAIEALTERIGCTQLGGTPVIGLAETVTPWGVDGLVHDPLTREPYGRHTLPYDHPLARATIALRVVVTLHGYTPITRGALEAAA
ncbi:hypothetical protein ACFWH1_09405 [Streptomyces sp. NPDC127037]|uniref:hypothetical protein n=1 Tax=Streptomyces sp. NPDC127037 TaxID=3347113 RepID=UPI0036500A02